VKIIRRGITSLSYRINPPDLLIAESSEVLWWDVFEMCGATAEHRSKGQWFCSIDNLSSQLFKSYDQIIFQFVMFLV
jgi:hypothetical protein